MTTVPNLNPIPVVTGDDLLISHDIATNRSGRISAAVLKDYISDQILADGDINAFNVPYNTSTVGAQLNRAVKTVPNYTTLSTLSGTIGDEVELIGHTVAGIGGGVFLCVDAAGLVGNTGTVVINGTIAWIRKECYKNQFQHIDVRWFGGLSGGSNHTALNAAINYAITFAQTFTSGGSVVEPTYVSTPYIKIFFASGNWSFTSSSTLPPSTYKANLTFEGESGTNIIGGGSNTWIDSTGGGCYKNKFKRLLVTKFGTALKIDTANKNEARVEFEECQTLANDIFVDTIGYWSVRSTLMTFKDCFFGDTRVILKGYTDHLTFTNCWTYAKVASTDALFYLSGDGVVKFDSCFFIPHGSQVSPVQDARWIDFVCDPVEGTVGDRGLKSLIITNCRASLESARPFIFFYDNTGVKPNGNNQACSITVEDSYIGGTGGYPVVWYKQGYPGSVTFRNAKVLSSPQICAIAPGNTQPPAPSIPSSITYHVISIDEATRLSQANGNNNATLIDPLLEPFCYDTTTQTSKFKRSIQKNIDYRLRCVAGATGQVKCTIPIFFDNANATHNRDLLSFMMTCVSDIGFAPAAGRAISTAIVSLVAGQPGGVDKKKVHLDVLSDAAGGLAFSTVCTPTVFFGSGNTGSDTIDSNSTSGAEDSITISFPGTVPEVCWVYIMPLAGLRENQQDKQQYSVW